MSLVACGDDDFGKEAENGQISQGSQYGQSGDANQSGNADQSGNANQSGDANLWDQSDASDDDKSTISFENVNVGDVITLGKYDIKYYDKEDGSFKSDKEKEDVEWEVIEISEDHSTAFAISKYVIDYIPYSDSGMQVTWEECTLRRWLNNEFYNDVFSNVEKNFIVEKNYENPDNEAYGTAGGNDTLDKVTILSVQELLRIYGGDKSAQENRKAADINGVMENAVNNSWWLRSPGADPSTKYYVLPNGAINAGGVTGNIRGVRPVICLNITNSAAAVPEDDDTEKTTSASTGSKEISSYIEGNYFDINSYLQANGCEIFGVCN